MDSLIKWVKVIKKFRYGYLVDVFCLASHMQTLKWGPRLFDGLVVSKKAWNGNVRSFKTSKEFLNVLNIFVLFWVKSVAGFFDPQHLKNLMMCLDDFFYADRHSKLENNIFIGFLRLFVILNSFTWLQRNSNPQPHRKKMNTQSFNQTDLTTHSNSYLFKVACCRVRVTCLKE